MLAGMASPIQQLLDNNRVWSTAQVERDPQFFRRLAAQQTPKYLWIGCSDSRVPANQILGLEPGEIFVHRNVANLVNHGDLNCLAVLQYAVEVLQVQHIIVTGHYGCGGVRASLESAQLGVIDHWLRVLRDLRERNHDELEALPIEARVNRLCELNVMAQVRHLSHSGIVQGAWHAGRPLQVHGLVYGIEDGCLRDLGVSQAGPEELPAAHRLDPVG